MMPLCSTGLIFGRPGGSVSALDSVASAPATLLDASVAGGLLSVAGDPYAQQKSENNSRQLQPMGSLHCLSLAEQDAAIDIDARAIDERSLIRRQVDNQLRDLLGVALKPERRHAGDPLTDFRLGEVIVEFGGNHARADCVDSNPSRPEFLGWAARH